MVSYILVGALEVALALRTCLPLQETEWDVKEMQVQSLGREGPLEESMAAHSSILAWTIPWTEEPHRPQSIGSQGVRHDWSNLASTHILVKGKCILR